MAEFEPKQFGKYYLLEKLAVGGMAEIYKAKTFGVDGFEKELAIKRILPHCSADKDFITMLIDEAKLSVLLSHANIVQVYDLGKVSDDYYISMEFIHGVNLRDIMYRCREGKIPIPLDIAVYIISEICKGLDYAHRKTDASNRPLNIVHRDISPQNILISYEGEVKIVDFGIAKAAMNISHTMAGILKGKIAYMSPEQAMGKAIDGRTDIFSTGILLYEMVTGTKLFTGESQFEVLRKIRTTRITAADLPDAIPAPLKPAVAKALAYGVEERYANAGDFQIDLTKFLYSTYVEFNPRKLAAFVKEIFASEIKEQQVERAREAAVEQQTSSMDSQEGAKQVELVRGEAPESPREETARARAPQEAFVETAMTRDERRAAAREEEATTGRREPKRKTSTGGRLLRAAALLAAVAAAGVLAVRFVPAVRFWESRPPSPEATEPAAAVPAVPATPPAAEPQGVLSVISEPNGAAIIVDGRATGKVTPAAVEKLPINREIRVTISKPDFADFDQTVTLTSAEPQKLLAKLQPLSPPPVPGGEIPQLPATPAEPVQPPVAPPVTPPVTPPATPTTPPVAEPPAPTAPAAKGSLAVTSTPAGARITIDGRATGRTTPATFPDLAVGGTYSVKFDLEGYRSVTRKKTLKVERETLSAALTKEEVKPPEPTTPPVTPPSQPAQPPVKPAEPTAPKGQEAGEGKIKVTSTPSGADVFINGNHRGTTPLTVSAPPGPATVLVSKEGMKASTSVTVKAGQTASASLKLEGAVGAPGGFGEVVITSTPPRASVVFDGQAIPAPTPVTIRKVPQGRQHSFTVSLDGFKPQSRSFTMEGESKSFSIQLQPQ